MFFFCFLLGFFCIFFVTRCSWIVISVSGTQIINKPLVWYSQNIPPMIKMLKQNMTQRGTQATCMGVMIGRCSPDSSHWCPSHHPAKVVSSFFRDTNDDLRNDTNHGRKRKTWTRGDNQLALHCYFKGNPSQRGYRKRMIEIWQEWASFQMTSQRLADKVNYNKERLVFWPWHTRNTPEKK